MKKIGKDEILFEKSFKARIFLILFFPIVALIYLSIYYMNARYHDLQEASTFMLSAQITKSISELVHNLQIERGVSSGYIVVQDKSLYRGKLLKRRALTDESYAIFLKFVSMKTDKIETINRLTFQQYEKNIKLALEQLHGLSTLRASIDDSSISFLEEAHFFRDSNAKLIAIIH